MEREREREREREARPPFFGAVSSSAGLNRAYKTSGGVGSHAGLNTGVAPGVESASFDPPREARRRGSLQIISLDRIENRCAALRDARPLGPGPANLLSYFREKLRSWIFSHEGTRSLPLFRKRNL
jgi:hypothetical protein